MLVAAPTGSGKTVVGEFAVHLALTTGPQVLLHHADQGAVQPEVPRPRRALRPRPGRAADRRQHRQRRGAGRRDDHRGAAQHAVRRLAHAARARLRGDGRGALPRRPLPRRGVGGGDHPPPGVGDGGRPCRRRSPTPRSSASGWQTVRGETTTIVEERRPVPLYQHVMVGKRLLDLFASSDVDAAAGFVKEGAPVNDELMKVARDDWASTRIRDRRSPAQARPRQGQPSAKRRATRQATSATGAGSGSRAGSTWSTGSTARGCCRRSSSSSAGSAATPRSSSASTPACG